MQFNFIDKRNATLVNDDGTVLKWNISGFDASKIDKVIDLFRELNGFLAWLPRAKRQTLWVIYTQLHEALETIKNLNLLEVELTDRVTELYDVLDLDDMDRWLAIHSDVVYPNDFATEHDPEDRTPDGTYLKKDYHGLVVLTMALRAMVVVWGGFLFLTRKTVGTNFKEYVSGRLIAESRLMQSAPVERLRRYIECRIARGMDTAPPIVDGLGTDEIPNWFLSNVMIRRLAIAEIHATTSGHLISNIFGFVNPKLSGMARVFGMVIEKYADGEEDGSDDGNSILEMFRAKQPLSIGDTAMFNVYMDNIYTVAEHVDGTLVDNLSLVTRCANDMVRHRSMSLHRTQEILLQWIIAKPTSPRAVPCLQKPALINTIVVAQAALLHWGFPDLAVLLSSTPSVREDDDMLSGVAQTRVPPELIETILKISPHNAVKDIGNPKKSNYVLLAIKGLAKDMHVLNWTVIDHPTVQSNIAAERIDATKRFKMPCDLEEQLTRLTIKLNDLR